MPLHPVRLLPSFGSGSAGAEVSATLAEELQPGQGSDNAAEPSAKATHLVTVVTATGTTSPQEKPSPAASRAEEGDVMDLTA